MSYRLPEPDFTGEIVRVRLGRLKQLIDEIQRCRAELGYEAWTGPIGDVEQAGPVRCAGGGVYADGESLVVEESCRLPGDVGAGIAARLAALDKVMR
jgi:hypothetical protein